MSPIRLTRRQLVHNEAVVLGEVTAGNARQVTIAAAVGRFLDIPRGKDPHRAVGEALRRLARCGKIRKRVGRHGWEPRGRKAS